MHKVQVVCGKTVDAVYSFARVPIKGDVLHMMVGNSTKMMRVTESYLVGLPSSVDLPADWNEKAIAIAECRLFVEKPVKKKWWW